MDGLDQLCLFGGEAALTMVTFLNLNYKVNLKKINYLIEKLFVYFTLKKRKKDKFGQLPII